MESRALVDTLIGFARTLAESADSADLTGALGDLTARVTRLLDVAGAGVSLARDGRLRFVTCGSAPLAGLARLQDDQQDGPGVDALRSAQPVVVRRLDAQAARWPAYVRHAGEVGVVALLAVPMGAGDPVGTVEVGHDAELDWTAEDIDAVRLFAELGAAVVRCATVLDRRRQTTEQLQTALDSRVVIEQAKGIVAGQHAITVEDAFSVLRRYANDRNLTLRGVADAVVRRGLRP